MKLSKYFALFAVGASILLFTGILTSVISASGLGIAVYLLVAVGLAAIGMALMKK
jgi:hypothetical protein